MCVALGWRSPCMLPAKAGMLLCIPAASRPGAFPDPAPEYLTHVPLRPPKRCVRGCSLHASPHPAVIHELHQGTCTNFARAGKSLRFSVLPALSTLHLSAFPQLLPIHFVPFFANENQEGDLQLWKACKDMTKFRPLEKAVIKHLHAASTKTGGD